MKKINIIKYILLLILFIGTIIFMNNSVSLYNETIVKVINVTNTNTEIKMDIKGINEQYILQKVKIKILNGEYKDNILTFENETTESNVYGEKYKVGDEIFVTLSDDENIEKIGDIRRDKYIVPLIVTFICLLLIVGNKQGLFSLIGLIINIIIMEVILYFRMKGVDIFYLFLGGTLLFTTISLLLSSGINRKTFIAILSSLVSLIISFLIAFIVIKIFEKQIPYWYMNYIEVMFDYEKVFLVGVLVGGLGAIMDISITITSTINELITNNKDISKDKLKKSGMEVAKDVMGTMVNVLFFTYIAGSIPMVLFVMRNKIPLSMAINSYAKVEIIRFLTSSIGLVLAIPIALFFTLKLIRRKEL